MSYRIAGIDAHKKMLAVVVGDVEEMIRELRNLGYRVEPLANPA